MASSFSSLTARHCFILLRGAIREQLNRMPGWLVCYTSPSPAARTMKAAFPPSGEGRPSESLDCQAAEWADRRHPFDIFKSYTRFENTATISDEDVQN